MTVLPYETPACPSTNASGPPSRLTVEEKAGQLTQYFYTGDGQPIPDDFDIDYLSPEHRIHVEPPRSSKLRSVPVALALCCSCVTLR